MYTGSAAIPARRRRTAGRRGRPPKASEKLRNPADAPREIAIDIGQVFELPEDAARRYALKSPYKDQRLSQLTLAGGKPHTFTLEAFEVLVFDATAR